MSDYVHELKTDPEVFDAVARGDKTHEIRRNDRNFLVGDTLALHETRYTGQEMSGPEPRPLEFTGRTATRVVSHVLEGYGLQPGWCVLSFAPTQGADTIIAHPGERVSMTWAQYVALTSAQGADARPVNQCDGCMAGHIIGQSGNHEYEGHAYMTCQAKRYVGADARPVAGNEKYELRIADLMTQLEQKEAARAMLARALEIAARATPADHSELGPYEFDVKLGEQMYVDSSMQYRNGTVTLTIKRKTREKESKLIQVEPSLTRCAAASDGECFHSQCPQLKDGEPAKSGRHCPIDTWKDDD